MEQRGHNPDRWGNDARAGLRDRESSAHQLPTLCDKKTSMEELEEKLGGGFGRRELLLSKGKPSRDLVVATLLRVLTGTR